jgi:hypothetical protein
VLNHIEVRTEQNIGIIDPFGQSEKRLVIFAVVIDEADAFEAFEVIFDQLKAASAFVGARVGALDENEVAGQANEAAFEVFVGGHGVICEER